MRSFSIINTITTIIFGRHIDLTSTESVVSVIHKREAIHTMPVVYESHEPLVQCFDTSADTTEISDEELTKYGDIGDTIDIHNIPSGQSLMLYNTFMLDYGGKIIYAGRFYSKELIYSDIHRADTRILNERKFNAHHMHVTSTATRRSYIVNNITAYNYISADIASVISSMTQSPANMRVIGSSVIENLSYSAQPVISMYRRLVDTSFVFNVNEHKVIAHNIRAVRIDTQRRLHNRNVCTMCVGVNFTGHSMHEELNGHIEYINVHNNTRRTHYTPYVFNYINSTIMPYMFNEHAMNNSCIGEERATQYRDIHTHSHILAISVSAGIALLCVTTICAVVFKPFKRFVRRLYGIIPLGTHNMNNEDKDIEDIELECEIIEMH